MKTPRLFDLHSTAARSLAVCAAGLTVCLSAPAFATVDPNMDDTWVRLVDATHPYASIQHAYDSNVFRIDTGAPAVGSRSDQITTISAGFDSNIVESLQRFEVSGKLIRDIHSTHAELDYTGGSGTAVWHWRSSPIWTGSVGFKYNRYLRDFANQATLDREKDVRSDSHLFGTVHIDLAGHWQMALRGDLADISFSTAQILNLKRTSGGTALEYVSTAGNVIGLDASVIDGNYERNKAANFDEYAVGPTLDWKFKPTLQVKAKVGYTARKYSGSVRQNYDDVTGRVTLTATGTGSGKLTASVWRDLSNLGDEIADFTLIHGMSIEPNWQLTNRIGVRVIASFEDRNFKAVVPGTGRKDEVYTGSVFADWAIGDKLTVTAGVGAQRRSSTRALQDYDFETVQLKITGRL